jgi:hypothetical protein
MATQITLIQTLKPTTTTKNYPVVRIYEVQGSNSTGWITVPNGSSLQEMDITTAWKVEHALEYAAEYHVPVRAGKRANPTYPVRASLPADLATYTPWF